MYFPPEGEKVEVDGMTFLAPYGGKVAESRKGGVERECRDRSRPVPSTVKKKAEGKENV